MTQTDILLPIAAMMLLIIFVAARMLRDRMREMRERRIHPDRVSSSSQMNALLLNTRASDNYKNLFEMPVLFYVLCLALYATESANEFYLAAAWVYVALRVVHSLIHLTHNKVLQRFAVFAASAVLLAGMWTCFALTLYFG
jgi:hypothetical protein